MKKLLSLIAMLTIIIINNGCEPKSQKPEEAELLKTPTGYIQKTLNGIDSATAIQMRQDFQTRAGNDKSPQSTSVWFSFDEIQDIVALLDTENARYLKVHPQATDTADGVRIYFASDPTVSTYPLNTSVLLVSTRNHGTNTKLCSADKVLHLDYYTHPANADLYKLTSSIYGQVCHGAKSCVGDSLYLTPSTVSTTTCATTPHGIPRDQAQKMVQSFGKDPVTTLAEWFDLPFLETVAKNKTANGGIRIYFAKNQAGGGACVSLKHTFVITTTKPDMTTGANADDFSCNGSSAKIAKAYSKHLASLRPLDVNDKGELCPDNCNPGDSLGFVTAKSRPKK